jgi:hypothetical protein
MEIPNITDIESQGDGSSEQVGLNRKQVAIMQRVPKTKD